MSLGWSGEDIQQEIPYLRLLSLGMPQRMAELGFDFFAFCNSALIHKPTLFRDDRLALLLKRYPSEIQQGQQGAFKHGDSIWGMRPSKMLPMLTAIVFFIHYSNTEKSCNGRNYYRHDSKSHLHGFW